MANRSRRQSVSSFTESEDEYQAEATEERYVPRSLSDCQFGHPAAYLTSRLCILGHILVSSAHCQYSCHDDFPSRLPIGFCNFHGCTVRPQQPCTGRLAHLCAEGHREASSTSRHCVYGHILVSSGSYRRLFCNVHGCLLQPMRRCAYEHLEADASSAEHCLYGHELLSSEMWRYCYHEFRQLRDDGEFRCLHCSREVDLLETVLTRTLGELSMRVLTREEYRASQRAPIPIGSDIPNRR